MRFGVKNFWTDEKDFDACCIAAWGTNRSKMNTAIRYVMACSYNNKVVGKVHGKFMENSLEYQFPRCKKDDHKYLMSKLWDIPVRVLTFIKFTHGDRDSFLDTEMLPELLTILSVYCYFLSNPFPRRDWEACCFSTLVYWQV